ncbi:tRNA uridine 5-oxyacetic acid(34) methyltransferase CmoM [Zobellella endophytica]|uniref:tRNA 5-carboxymethoxyuridine methyltransferase n=1 Tax=Zobellella endophytica TaxID=2116700 RepID=A0A2P7RCJ3_9GAMM|nr:methyltransferase domain-containing protein [Zobellella endophytica]PSJ47941.1 tRNA uridine 5-oxyacetic acid(34) methyltransferase CmoM [Zobellella endophytica]
MQPNTSFDGKSHTFSRNIYGTTKGRIRLAVLGRDLDELLQTLPPRPLRILDAGGGFGPLSQPLAALGHRVVLCDLSGEMLALARAQVEEKGLNDRFDFIQGPIQSLSAEDLGRFDLILCHAVLEWVEDQAGLLATLHELLADDGHLSLMFYNRDGLLFHSLVMGNFDYIHADLVKKRRQKLTPGWPCRPEQVYRWLAELGFAITGRSGVRVLHDYMVDRQVKAERPEEVIAMELAHARREPFVHLGRYIHVLARKGAGPAPG